MVDGKLFVGLYTPAKDLFLYLKNKNEYINDLNDNFYKLSVKMCTIDSRMKQIDDTLDISPSKEKLDEYDTLKKQVEVFHKKYTKLLSKYQKLCGNLPSLPEPKATTSGLSTTVQEHIAIPEVDVLTARNVIDDPQTRKPTIFTLKFFALAGLSKDISKLLDHVSQVIDTMKEPHLISEKKHDVFQMKHDEIGHPRLDEYVPMVMKYLNEDVKRIAIVGPVGVGKTTIMKNLNNQLENRNSFLISNRYNNVRYDIIIWVTCPTDLDAKDKIVGKIQDEIMTRLKLDKVKTQSPIQNAEIISKFLHRKKYILLMDQVASYIDLDEVGIHKQHNHGRVVIASSHVKVVNRMVNEKVEIKTLSDNDALNLFQEVRGTICDKRIQNIADEIIKLCGGLPLVIKLIATYLKGETDDSVWHATKKILQSDMSNTTLGLAGVGNAFKLAYEDSKMNNSMKKCLLYAALFPNDYIIFKDYLVECWTAEGFIDKNGTQKLRAARDNGVFVLKELTDRYLLEKCADEYVKIPAYFRKMALEQKYPDEENCVVWVSERNKLIKDENWRTAKRVSLIGYKSELPESPESDNICTLLLQCNPEFERLGDSFFLHMKKLQVLDLHQIGIRSLPSSISSLENLIGLYLNDCSHLSMLPPQIGKLDKLELLDIRGTSIPWLPQEIGSMIGLRCLRVSFFLKFGEEEENEIEVSSSKIISNLEQLEELTIEVDLQSQGWWMKVAEEIAIEVAGLKKLTTLNLNFPSVSSLHKFITNSQSWKNIDTNWGTDTFRSFKLFIGFQETRHPYGSDISGNWSKRRLRFSTNGKLSSVKEVLTQASAFELIGNSNVKSFNEFDLENVGPLKVCVVEGCNSLLCLVDTQVIDERNANGILQSLEKLHLFDLKVLQCIWSGSVSPQSLSNLTVLTLCGCPELTEVLKLSLVKALSCLKHLKVEKCFKIVRIIEETSIEIRETHIFEKLELIELEDLPLLESICGTTLMTWKSLMKIVSIRCSKLINLSMNTDNAERLETIMCEASWWGALQFPSEEVKEHFGGCCQIISVEHPVDNEVPREEEIQINNDFSESYLCKDFSSASIFEHPDSNAASISKLHGEQRSKAEITDEETTVDEISEISEIESNPSQAKITDQVSTVNEKTKIPHSLILLEAELGKPNEKMLISASGFDTKHEGESSTYREAAQLEPETTFSTGAEEISVEQTEAEAVNLHSSHKYYLDGTSKGITISVTGEMSKFVDLNLILRTFSSQETQRQLDSGLSYNDLVPKMEDYRFLVKKKFDHQSSGPHESAPVTTGALIPEHLILNKAICGTNEVAVSDKWGQACVVNFIEKNFASLPENPNCPNLVLLFLQRNNRLSSIPSSFFQNMPALCFLDLSNTRIRTLPNSLFNLTRLEVLMLRNCAFLDNLPSEISKLERIEVLDLSGTELNDLPKEIVQLTRLRHLLLSFYGPDNESEYAHLPSKLLCHGIISELKALQALSIVVHPEDHRWTTIASNIVQEVGKLEMLGYLQIYIPNVDDFNLFIEGSPLWNEKVLTKYKFVVGNDVKRIVSRIPNGLESNYDHLDQCLRFVNGDKVDVIKKVVAHVTAFYLDHHVEIKSLSDFGISSFKDLRFLVVRECPKVEEIIDEKISESVFPSLERLSIHYLWKLKHIRESHVPPGSFRALKYLIVHMCPQLQFILSESMLRCLFNLEEFVVEDCESVKILIEEGEGKVQHNAVKLPRLRNLRLHYLPKLVTLGIDLHLSEEQISVDDCPSFEFDSLKDKAEEIVVFM